MFVFILHVIKQRRCCKSNANVGGDNMMTIDMMKQELQYVKAYYDLNDEAREIEKDLDLSGLKKMANKYNQIIVLADPRLIRLYHSLYIKGISQNKLAKIWHYTPENIRKQCRKLDAFLLEKINQSQKEIS